MTTERGFLNARTQIIAKIHNLEKELKYWRDELSAFDRVEITMARFAGGQSVESRDKMGELSPVVKRAVEILEENQKRGELKKRVLGVITANKGKEASSKDVERALLQSGFVPKGKHFDISVYQTLLRLADEQKLIRKIKRDKNIRFTTNES